MGNWKICTFYAVHSCEFPPKAGFQCSTVASFWGWPLLWWCCEFRATDYRLMVYGAEWIYIIQVSPWLATFIISSSSFSCNFAFHGAESHFSFSFASILFFYCIFWRHSQCQRQERMNSILQAVFIASDFQPKNVYKIERMPESNIMKMCNNFSWKLARTRTHSLTFSEMWVKTKTHEKK